MPVASGACREYHLIAKCGLDGVAYLRPLCTDEQYIDDFEIVDFNDYCESLLKLRREEFLGCTLKTALPGIEQTPYLQRLRKVMRTYDSFEECVKLTSSTLDVTWIRLRVTAAGDGLIIVLRQESDSARLHERLKEVEHLAVAGQLAVGVVHDVNNMLGVVTAMCDLVREVAANEPRRVVDIDQAIAAAMQAGRYCRHLLDHC